MRLTLTEQHYLECLAEEMNFEEIALELGWTVEEVEDFGTKFFDQVFETKKRIIT